MRKLVLLSLILITTFSCMNKNPYDGIESPISPKEFQLLIKDVGLMNAHLQNSKKYSLINRDSIGSITLEILQKKGFSKKDLMEAVRYYASQPQKLDSLIADLKDTLKENQIKISHDYIEDYENMPNDSLTKILMQYPYLGKLNFKNDFTLSDNTKDSIIIYFSKNRNKLNNYRFKTFIDKFNAWVNLKNK